MLRFLKKIAPCRFGFARSISFPDDFSQTLEGETIVPTSVYQHLLIIPTKLPVFPHNSLVTQVHPYLSDFIDQQKIKHIGAFVLREDAQPHIIEPSEFKALFKPEEVDEPIASETSAILPTKQPKDLASTYLDNFHQNIIYESQLPTDSEHPAQANIRFISSIDEVYPIGTICRISFQKFEEPGKEEQVYLILKGLQRIQLIQKANVKTLDTLITHVKVQPIRDHSVQFVSDTNYQIRLSQLLGIYAKLRQKIPINVPELIKNPTDPSTIDILCGFLCLTTFFDQQALITLFSTIPIHERLQLCQSYFERYSKELYSQWDALEAQTNLPVDPQTQKQKMKEIYDFLKKQSQNSGAFVQKIMAQMEGRTFPPHIAQMLQDELAQMGELSENHPDFNSKKNFVELLVSLPFGVSTEDNYTLKKAEEILNSSHYGLQQVKARVLEFLAVSKLRQTPSGKTLLLAGPPGVGKTSIAAAIAECLGRKFVRVSLGGESDVAIIKGHRRTYMASYPGKIVQALKQAQTENPVILLDEIDKLGRSYRGSISDALLEVLDPVQNNNFIDNYLEVGIDLSKVLFICSANLLDTIPQPLYDRMELIQLSGYTIEEKLHITQNHLIPKILKDTGLNPFVQGEVLSSKILVYIIQYYCRESGVRSLQRTLQRLYEKLVMKVVKHQQLKQEGGVSLSVTQNMLEDLIGLPPFEDTYVRKNTPGLGVGLAYNAYGGSLMYIEIVRTNYVGDAEVIKDKSAVGSLKITGQLGNTIKESVQIAYTHAKYVLHQHYGNHFLEDSQLHMHFPAGAVKKDGPSAGIAIASALVSIALNKPIKAQTAMTGELSLTGKVLRIGGLKEKVLAAKREGILEIIIPEGNRGDLEDLPESLKEGIKFHLVEEFMQVVTILF